MKARVDLTTMEGINAQLTGLYERVMDGKIEPKFSDAANTVLKTAVKVNAELPLKYGMLLMKSKGSFPIDIPLLRGMIKSVE